MAAQVDLSDSFFSSALAFRLIQIKLAFIASALFNNYLPQFNIIQARF